MPIRLWKHWIFIWVILYYRWRFIYTYFKCFQIQSNSSLYHISPNHWNSIFIETVKENCRLLIISIYRPPNANAILFIDKLYELMSLISRNGYDEVILCGDFNPDILNYDNNDNTLNLLNSLTSQSLIPIITKPSRITDQTATLIDNIYINQPNGFVSGILISDISDHLPLFILKRNLFTKKNFSTKHKCEISSNQWLDHY